MLEKRDNFFFSKKYYFKNITIIKIYKIYHTFNMFYDNINILLFRKRDFD